VTSEPERAAHGCWPGGRSTPAGLTAVVTGGACGLGRALALEAARRGMNVVLADVDAVAMAETRDAVRAHGAGALAVPTDVSDEAQVQALAGAAWREFGAVHLLFNNAGVALSGPVWESSAHDWQWVWGVNVGGVANGLRAFVPRMLAQTEGGHVVNTASLAGLVCAPGVGVYNATKHAVIAMTETLHHDLRLASARVGCAVLCPGFMPTGIAAAERSRPATLANAAAPSAAQRRAAREMRRAVAQGARSADEVARAAFDGIAQGRFYLLTHPGMRAAAAARVANIVSADPLAPADPSRLPATD
jgi:NAD(P)-dependent dehydrogenase (short-subunit alcohol dehydrogenase family)